MHRCLCLAAHWQASSHGTTPCHYHFPQPPLLLSRLALLFISQAVFMRALSDLIYCGVDRCGVLIYGIEERRFLHQPGATMSNAATLQQSLCYPGNPGTCLHSASALFWAHLLRLRRYGIAHCWVLDALSFILRAVASAPSHIISLQRMSCEPPCYYVHFPRFTPFLTESSRPYRREELGIYRNETDPLSRDSATSLSAQFTEHVDTMSPLLAGVPCFELCQGLCEYIACRWWNRSRAKGWAKNWCCRQIKYLKCVIPSAARKQLG
ncbi:hypothetical protein H4582DRAFT_1895105 [Lactarius indigo]|nr:hypothetical protein H4582DRAFT_1895105 [Lactarius indigo]